MGVIGTFFIPPPAHVVALGTEQRPGVKDDGVALFRGGRRQILHDFFVVFGRGHRDTDQRLAARRRKEERRREGEERRREKKREEERRREKKIDERNKEKVTVRVPEGV